MAYRVGGLLFGVALVAAGVLLWQAPRQWPDAARKLPRERIVGGVLGLLCLLWAAWLAGPMLEGGLAGLRPLLLPAAVVLGVAGALLLDYVLTRALGGALVLVCTWMMHEAFVAHTPARQVLTVLYYLLGVAGLFMIGTPYRFRDFLEWSGQSARGRLGVAAGLALTGLLTVGLVLASRG